MHQNLNQNLINAGYVALALKEAQAPGDLRGVLEVLSTKLGVPKCHFSTPSPVTAQSE